MQNEDFTTITKPKQLRVMDPVTSTLYLKTANLKQVYKLETKNNVRIQLRFLRCPFSLELQRLDYLSFR